MKVRILGLVMLVGLVSRPALATSVSVQPAANSVTHLDTFLVDIEIVGAADIVSLQFDLTFDHSVLSLDSIDEGTFLTAVGSTFPFFLPDPIDSSADTITFVDALTGNDPGASGAGLIARLRFTGIAPGSSALTLSNLLVGALIPDGQGGFVPDTDPLSPFFGLFAVTFDDQIPTEDGSVIVAAPTASDVPEPSTLALIGTGLAAAVRRRRANRAA